MATTVELNALAADGSFRRRVRNLALQIAAEVYAEDAGTPNHVSRANFAIKLFQNPSVADALADVLVTRTNLTGSVVSYNFADGQITTDATDAAIKSQLATDWAMLAGV